MGIFLSLRIHLTPDFLIDAQSFLCSVFRQRSSANLIGKRQPLHSIA